jgi:hypothetical protein
LNDFSENERQNFKMRLSSFENYIINTSINNVVMPSEQSMDYPVTDYYVYSSHNTYLKGHQLYGLLLFI